MTGMAAYLQTPELFKGLHVDLSKLRNCGSRRIAARLRCRAEFEDSA
jgi:hypothetical protein